GDELVGLTCRLERRLGLVDRSVLDEAGVVCLLPDPVVHLDDLDVADLEFHHPLLEQVGIRFLSKGRADEFQRPIENEGCGGCSRRDDESTTRDAMHFLLPGCCKPTNGSSPID